MQMALTGYNGDNETNIGLSRSFDFSLLDESMTEYQVNNVSKTIDLWISRDTSVLIQPYQYINITSLKSSITNLNGSKINNGYLMNGFQLNGTSVSIHIQLKPLNKSVAYLSLLKFGDNPTLENNYSDIMNIFCPKDLINDTYHLTFLNMSQINKYKGYMGYSLIELDATKIDCLNKSNNSLAKLSELKQNQSNFTSNLWLRIYSSGCYYMDTLTNKWSSFGMEILSDSNDTHVHCQSNHLTTFAGGFLVLPNAINFNYVWSHASFTQNPVIYSTVIAVVCIYIILAIWCRYNDCKDKEKCGIALLGDFDEEKYFYEIVIFTGARLNAGTQSKVIDFEIEI